MHEIEFKLERERESSSHMRGGTRTHLAHIHTRLLSSLARQLINLSQVDFSQRAHLNLVRHPSLNGTKEESTPRDV
jgi:hypothetical protein